MNNLTEQHNKQIKKYFERLEEKNTDRIGDEWCFTTKLLLTGYVTCLLDSNIIDLKTFDNILDKANQIYDNKYSKEHEHEN